MFMSKLHENFSLSFKKPIKKENGTTTNDSKITWGKSI